MSNIIKEKTTYIEADQLKEVEMTNTFQIRCRFITVGFDDTQTLWHGEIQKVYLDKKGEAYGYDVYVY